eukprot:scaffold7017_cov134-Cylindrotheca_fusiformis.AAC.27
MPAPSETSLSSPPEGNQVKLFLGGYWQTVIDLTNREETHLEKKDDDTTSTTSAGASSSGGGPKSPISETESVCSQEPHAPIPQRLVDYFCVIGADMQIKAKSSSKTEYPSQLEFQPKLIDCVPKTRDDIDFPAELPMFCFPDGCKLSTEQRSAQVFSFVLTAGTGHRLYLSAATLSEPYTPAEVCELFWDAGYSLPPWLADTPGMSSTFYLPKTIVVVSHHPFYAVHTKFLDRLLNIQNSESPLPIERYIANFVYDIPLPIPGGAVVRWDCFGKATSSIEMAQTASNKLPLVNFSYEPLFRTLSVTNILVLWGVLLDEGRVVFRSKHLSLLTPIVEALLSLLFPFTWQGMYIPLLPSDMMDVLDAPVPFLVGVNGKCPQPVGVVVCDLDEDIVHLGWDDSCKERPLPLLPRKAVLRLKSELSEVADPLYLIPACGLKGRVTTGDEKLLRNSMRELYAHMSVLKQGSTEDLRGIILSKAGSVQLKGTAKSIEKSKCKLDPPDECDNEATSRQVRVVGLSYTGMKRQQEVVAASFYDINTELERTARTSFMDFFASVLQHYRAYNKGEFQRDDFLNTFTGNSRVCAETIVRSQMFERFLNESSTRRRLFDDFILVYLDESLRQKEEQKRHHEAAEIAEVIIPLPPCRIGVAKNAKFAYKAFPKLDEDELVGNSNVRLSRFDFSSCCCDPFMRNAVL